MVVQKSSSTDPRRRQLTLREVMVLAVLADEDRPLTAAEIDLAVGDLLDRPIPPRHSGPTRPV